LIFVKLMRLYKKVIFSLFMLEDIKGKFCNHENEMINNSFSLYLKLALLAKRPEIRLLIIFLAGACLRS
jgi:hypothetical protein